MLNINKLENNFYPVVDLGENIIRCADELNNKTIYTYVNLRHGDGYDVIVVSDDIVDDKFSQAIFQVCPKVELSGIRKEPLSENEYGFSHLILADSDYFSDLGGRLDDEKQTTYIAIPIFEPEFSGDESAEDFYELRRNVVPTNDWNRTLQPKAMLRFDNPGTGSGTGEEYVFAKFNVIELELKNLPKSQESFVEIINFRNQVLEILPTESDIVDVILDRDDNNVVGVNVSDINTYVWNFLTT